MRSSGARLSNRVLFSSPGPSNGRRSSSRAARGGARRGAIWLEALLLVGVVVLAGSGAVRAFSGSLEQVFACLGDGIRQWTETGSRGAPACRGGQEREAQAVTAQPPATEQVAVANGDSASSTRVTRPSGATNWSTHAHDDEAWRLVAQAGEVEGGSSSSGGGTGGSSKELFDAQTQAKQAEDAFKKELDKAEQAVTHAALGAHAGEFESQSGVGEAARAHFAGASVPIELPTARAGRDVLQGGAGTDTLAALEQPPKELESEKPTKRLPLVPSDKEIFISQLVRPLGGVGADDVRAVTDSISRLDPGALLQTPMIVIVPPSAPPIPRQPSGLWVRVLEGRVTGSDGNPLLREVGMSIESSLRERGQTGVLEAQRAAAARDRAGAPALVTRERIEEITSFAESFELYYTQPTVFRALAPALFEFWSSDPLLQVTRRPFP